jgi:hypothetical protein
MRNKRHCGTSQWELPGTTITDVHSLSRQPWPCMSNSPVSIHMTLAHISFPTPSAAYFANLFSPVSTLLALATEFAILAYFQRGVSSK